MRPFVHLLLAVLVAVSLSLALGACGKKSDPEPPEGSEYPRHYPDQ
ncbi:MAG: hypothetical protein ISR48_09110 [Alphaproteobacteria bacterium]|nr:hypothetical protein [Alphaproteobacteria bacterium]